MGVPRHGKLESFRVTDSHEVQAAGAGSVGTLGSVPGAQQLLDPGHGPQSSAHQLQRTRDIPHHVVEKGIGLDVHEDQIIAAGHSDPGDLPYRVPGLALGGTKSTEVLLTQQALARPMHQIDIKGSALLADQTGQVRR